MIAAVAYYYSKQGKYLIIISSLKFPGDKNRAKSLLNSTKKCVDICGVELLCRAESMLDTDDDFKSLLGPFYYKPDFYFQGEISMVDNNWLFQLDINCSQASSSEISSVLDSTCPNE